MEENKIIKLGEVGVDSGQLVICDPAYLGKEGQFLEPDSEGKSDHAHTIYKHRESGKLWQFCYNEKPSRSHVNPFPGTYTEIIPEYGKCPNDLKASGEFVKTDMDPTPHIPLGEFSYRGVSKITVQQEGGQLNYGMGHAGVAVAFRSGLGDGTYGVFAELADTGQMGVRVKKVWVELITDDELKDLRNGKAPW